MKHLKFAENLRESMKMNKVSQQKLAEHLGTTQATVSRWTKGITEPGFLLPVKICLFLGETPNSILGYDEIKTN